MLNVATLHAPQAQRCNSPALQCWEKRKSNQESQRDDAACPVTPRLQLPAHHLSVGAVYQGMASVVPKNSKKTGGLSP